MSAAPVEILEMSYFGFLVLMAGGSLLLACKTLAGLNFPKLDCTEMIRHMLECECNTEFRLLQYIDTLIQ